MRAFESYSVFNMLYTIPSIVLSTVSGTASFATDSMPNNIKLYAPMAIGTINIFVGIITTLQRYFKIAELNEAYKVAYINWDKFARNIQIEISKDPKQRTNAKSFFKATRMEYDRLTETCPPIPPFIIRKFSKMKNNESVGNIITDMMKTMGIIKIEENIEEDDEDFLVKQLHVPDIFDKIESSYLSSWYKKEKKIAKMIPTIPENSSEPTEKKIRMTDLVNETVKTLKKNKMKKIDDFIQNFKKMNEREPLQYEIEEHFKDTDVEKVLAEYLTIHGYSAENAIDNV